MGSFRRLVVFIGACSAVFLLVGVAFASHWAGDRSDHGAWVTPWSGQDPEAADREAVAEVARQFALRIGTYGPDQLVNGKLPAYADSVREIITAKFRASFDQNIVIAEKLASDAGQYRITQLGGAGVSSLDDDSATALVAGTFWVGYTTSTTGKPIAPEPFPFRLQLSLVKQDGSWLVDFYAPVTEPTGQAPQTAPSDQPTGAAQ